MFEVAVIWLTEVRQLLPSLIALYVLFDLMSSLMPGVKR
jgi:hypothetical protein